MPSFTISCKNHFPGAYQSDLQNSNPYPNNQQIYMSFVENSVFCATCKPNTKFYDSYWIIRLFWDLFRGKCNKRCEKISKILEEDRFLENLLFREKITYNFLLQKSHYFHEFLRFFDAVFCNIL